MKKILKILPLTFFTVFLFSQEEAYIKKFQTFPSYKNIGYDQDLRSQFHFSSLKGWNNDPNGMVFYDGEYHLFFQLNTVFY